MNRYSVNIPEPKAKRLDKVAVYIGYEEGFSGHSRTQEIKVPIGATQLIFDVESGYVPAWTTNVCDASIFIVMAKFTKDGSTREEIFVLEPILIKSERSEP